MKILHLINDEKFTDFTISLFEECNPGNNIFLVGIKDDNLPPKYTQTRMDQMAFYVSGSVEYFKYIENCVFDVLIVHFMDYYKSLAVCRIKRGPVIVWLAWGADIYNTVFYKQHVYQKYTTQLLSNIENQLVKKMKSLFKVPYYLFSLRMPPSIAYKNAVRKVDFCATVIPDEINILREWNFFHAKQVPFSYASVEYDFEKNEDDANVKGNGIIIGNSIDPSSNHVDVFKKLISLPVDEREIVVPLSYGNRSHYLDMILKEGQKLFGNNFKPLMNFMSKDEYIRILGRCNIAIMNHDRQQGLGNLIILLWMGCKIFLSEKSVSFSYFKRKGFFVYSFQSDLDRETVKISLTEEQMNRNRELLLCEYGHKNVLQKVHTLINQISGKHDEC